MEIIYSSVINQLYRIPSNGGCQLHSVCNALRLSAAKIIYLVGLKRHHLNCNEKIISMRDSHTYSQLPTIRTSWLREKTLGMGVCSLLTCGFFPCSYVVHNLIIL